MKEMIDINNLQEVTSPVLFQRGDIPHPDGLVSNEIFGVTVQSRKNTFAYINLEGHFFHPHVYKSMKRMFRNIIKIVTGEQYYSIDKDGHLVLDERGDTGLEFLYANWNKIKWDRSEGQSMRNERIALLENFKKNEVFTQYELVIPPFYRDIRTSSSGGETGELNKYYANLIRYAAMLKEKDMFDFQLYQTYYNVQETLVAIYDYFKSKLEHKSGILRRYLLGKNVDYCTRTVITSPNFHANTPKDMITDFKHCAVPISQVCSLCHPFVVKWVKDFFEREVFNEKNNLTVYDVATDSTTTVELDNPEAVFTDKWMKKLINTFIRDPESRFNTIELPVKDSKQKRYMAFSGRRLDPTTKEEISELVHRPLTWTDILYQACCDVVKDKHALITRYPVTDEFGVFVTAIRVASTTKTTPVMLNGQIYEWYPVIELDTDPEKIAIEFVDSVQFSNSYLPGINGDYDGDQTTIKILFTQEANEEVEKVINNKAYFIAASGKMIRAIESEAIQTFYAMTKVPNKNFPSNDLNASEALRFQEMKPEDITFEFLIDTFADIKKKDSATGIEKSRYNLIDTLDIRVPYLGFTGKTTLGRLMYNKVIIEGCKLDNVLPYINEPITDKFHGKMEGIIADALKEDKITVEQMYQYIDTRDWLGFQLHGAFTTSFTIGIIKKPKEVQVLHDELMKKYKDRLDAGDVVAAEEMEKQLIAKTKEVLKDDIGMDLYASGARGSIENNLKNVNLMRGAIYNRATGGYDIITNSLLDGLDKKDLSPHSNSCLEGAYSKAVGTADTGYLSKELLSSMQAEVLDEPGSDCGSKRTIEVTIPGNKDLYLYRYIVENGKLICLTPDVIGKYMGKKVKMRSPLYCCGEHLCSKCAGEYFYKLGKRFVGLTTSRVATTCTNLNMKKFHENLVKTWQINLEDMLI